MCLRRIRSDRLHLRYESSFDTNAPRLRVPRRFQQLHGRHPNDARQTTVRTLLVLHLVHFGSDHHSGRRVHVRERRCCLTSSRCCSLRQVVFFTSIIRFRTPTEGNYVYPVYANVLGWLMVGSSLIFIPCVMIYELIKAWRMTSHRQHQVNATNDAQLVDADRSRSICSSRATFECRITYVC
jgi:hypothetical protein